jgi:phosphoheptose isomerase
MIAGDTWMDRHEREVQVALTTLRQDWPTLQSWGAQLAERFAAGGRLLTAGNGGSAAEAQHLTAELVGRFVTERRPYSAICLSAETSSLTAIVNDYGVNEMFARQVEAHGRPGDVLILLSTSGRSPNVLCAAERAAEVGVSSWAITGPGPNPLSVRCDEALTIRAPSTAAIQAAHLIAVHGLCAVVDEVLALTQPPALGRQPAARAGLREIRETVFDSELTG